MRLRGTIVGFGVGVAFAVGGFVAPGVAHASTVSNEVLAAPAPGKFYDDFLKEKACRDTGDWLVLTGQYKYYICEWSSPYWNLYVA
ncbi:hypothetical protein [Actinoplanes siamensis]|uniref:Uncharacterized protein n=1 Tax=Actinoplanes siamensis TaxID=1223317 RepID=A0A919N601_9ACTN|nr:hypothetical protein [Actinoplanes siamensis]GIF04991.1 hypothetical protein Asi03nite_25290 [Actinoplanes siamensis]